MKERIEITVEMDKDTLGRLLYAMDKKEKLTDETFPNTSVQSAIYNFPEKYVFKGDDWHPDKDPHIVISSVKEKEE